MDDAPKVQVYPDCVTPVTELLRVTSKTPCPLQIRSSELPLTKASLPSQQYVYEPDVQVPYTQDWQLKGGGVGGAAWTTVQVG